LPHLSMMVIVVHETAQAGTGSLWHEPQPNSDTTPQTQTPGLPNACLAQLIAKRSKEVEVTKYVVLGT